MSIVSIDELRFFSLGFLVSIVTFGTIGNKSHSGRTGGASTNTIATHQESLLLNGLNTTYRR